MESGIQSSFIPQEAEVVVSNNDRYAGSTDGLSDLFTLFAVVLFVASLALAGGVFLYEQFLSTQTSQKIEDLARAKAAFDPALVQRLIRLDDRMRTAQQLLEAHPAPSVVLEALNQSTLTTVSFGSFGYDAADAKNITVTMSGLARSINSVALQDDVFSKNDVLTNPIFTGIARQADGVHFNVKTDVNHTALKYSKLVVPAAPASDQGATQQGLPVSNSPFNREMQPAQ